jgi:hypothetical protein
MIAGGFDGLQSIGSFTHYFNVSILVQDYMDRFSE